MNEVEISVDASRKLAKADWNYLSKLLQRLRLMLKRRALWLRSRWADDALHQQCYQGLVISDINADWLLAGDERSSEEQFYARDATALEISRDLTELDEELKNLRTSQGALPSVEMLVQLFKLTAFEREVLLLCIAPELDPSFERIFAYVQDDATRRYATFNLALTLFDSIEKSHEARLSMSANGPLRRLGLIVMEQGPTPATARDMRPLRIEEGIADYILGMRRLDERAAELLWEVTPLPLPDPYPALVDGLESFVRPELERGGSISINLIGPAESGRMAVACSLCERLGLRLFKLDPHRMPTTEPDRKEILRLLEREALLFQAAFYIYGSDDGKESMDLINRIIDSINVPLIVGSVARWRSSRAQDMLPIDIPKADAKVRRQIWQQAMPGYEGALEKVAQQFEFGPHSIVEAASRAGVRSRLRGSLYPNREDLWKACREQSSWQAGGLAQPIVPATVKILNKETKRMEEKPLLSLEDIVLPKDTSDQLKEIADQVMNRSRVYDEWGFGRKLTRGKGISAIFSGPSGTGKTMAAEILANYLDLDLYRIDLSAVVNKYIGETEKNLKKVFDAAEMSGAILFFDEADALFGKRTEVKDSHDRYANIEVNYLLQRMEDYRGLAILATNRKSFLDQAFMRRIRFIVDFPFPDANSRGLIWQKTFPEESLMEYIFSWDEIPGKDDDKLIDFLRQRFSIDWPTAKGIEKNSNDKVVKIIADDRSLSLELNDDRTEVTLKISDGRTSKLIARDEDGELNIYSLEGIDYNFLSRLEITGGNIRNIAVNSAFLAAKEGVPIDMNHIMRSAKREYAKIEKLLSEDEFGKYYKPAKS